MEYFQSVKIRGSSAEIGNELKRHFIKENRERERERESVRESVREREMARERERARNMHAWTTRNDSRP